MFTLREISGYTTDQLQSAADRYERGFSAITPQTYAAIKSELKYRSSTKSNNSSISILSRAMKSTAIIALLGSLAGGCAHVQYVPAAGMPRSPLQQAEAECQLQAEVATLNLGNNGPVSAFNAGLQQVHLKTLCMKSKGWTISQQS